jgi:phosphoglycerate dehydrogenase-like enzyme
VSVRIAVLDDYLGVAAALADWSGELPDADVSFFRAAITAPDQLVAALAGYDIVVAMRERTPFPREVLAQLPKLRLLVTTGMRNAAIDVDAAHELGIAVAGTRGHPWSTSELTWSLILALLRPVQVDDGAIRNGGWQRQLGRDLDGATLGLLGLGRQGGRVARVGLAFGMNVLAWSPNLTPERAAEQQVEAVAKRELFERADVVSLHVVLGERSRGVIGEPELRALGPDSFLVNTARAGLVDQVALRAALEQGWIAGAGLDVYDIEPLPADHWIRSAPRTVLSPHMGYVSNNGYRVFYGDAVDDIAAFRRGEPLRLL